MSIKLDDFNDFLQKVKNYNKNDNFKNGVFGLDEEVESKDKFVYLNELKVTIDEFMQKGDNLFMVAFVGDFSTGKSTTINKLLEQDIRKSSEHPTDNGITLISDNKNNHYLEKITTETKRIPVRKQMLDSELLKNMILVDSPGSGDKDIAHEVVREFMPLCDCIYYFFHPSHPFDESDIPFLKKKYEELAFLPMKIVITHADLFRKDIDAKLNEDNFDNERYDSFVQELFDRIKKDIGNMELSIERDVYVVGNIHNFRIDKLKDSLATINKNIDNTQAIEIYKQKERYFYGKVKEGCEFFVKKAEFLKDAFDSYLKELKENKDKYDSAVQLNFTNLNDNWQNINSKIEKQKSNLSKSNIKEPLLFNVDFLEMDKLKQEVAQVKAVLDELGVLIAKGFIDSLDAEYKRVEFDFFEKLTKTVGDIAEIDDFLDIGKIDKAIYISDKTELDYLTNVNNMLKGFDTLYKKVFDDIFEKIVTNSNSIRDLTNEYKNNYIKQYNSFVLECNNDLITAFREFYIIIDMYLKGILNISQSVVVEKLGLKEELRATTEVFDESKKQKIEDEAKKNLYGDFETIKNDYIDQLREIHNECKSLQDKFSGKKIDIENGLDFTIDEKFESIEYIVGDANSKLQEVKNNIVNETKRINIEIKNDYKQKAKELEDEKKSAVLWFVGGVVLFFIIAWFVGVNYDWIEKDSIISGLVVFAITVVGSGVVAKIRDSIYRTSVRRLKKDVIKRLQESVNDLVIEEHRKWKEEQRGFNKKIEDTVRKDLEDKFKLIKQNDKYKQFSNAMVALREVYKNEEVLFTRYKRVAAEFLNEGQGMFKRDKNFDILTKITKKIKDEAIKPSQELLESKSESIVEIYEDLDKIKKNILSV